MRNYKTPTPSELVTPILILRGCLEPHVETMSINPSGLLLSVKHKPRL